MITQAYIDTSPALPESAPDFIHKIPQSPQKNEHPYFSGAHFSKA